MRKTDDIRRLSLEDIAEQHPLVYDELIPLLRPEPGALDAYLKEVSIRVAIGTSKCTAHCYFLALDGDRKPRVRDFARFLGTKIVDFAISRKEIEEAFRRSLGTGSTSPIVALNNKAKRLFTQLPKTGEGGEVLLSLLAEAFLGLPQLFTKMILKTDSEMHVHGADGIHAGVNLDSGQLAIYWGESKLYGDVSSGIRDCFASLAPFLKVSGGSDAPRERELQLMRDHLSLTDPKLICALKHYLDPDDPMHLQLQFRGLCLVGHSSDSYPSKPNSKEIDELREEIRTAFEASKAQILRRLEAEEIEGFYIEIFCLPFPNVEEFRQAFRRELGFIDE